MAAVAYSTYLPPEGRLHLAVVWQIVTDTSGARVRHAWRCLGLTVTVWG